MRARALSARGGNGRGGFFLLFLCGFWFSSVRVGAIAGKQGDIWPPKRLCSRLIGSSNPLPNEPGSAEPGLDGCTKALGARLSVPLSQSSGRLDVSATCVAAGVTSALPQIASCGFSKQHNKIPLPLRGFPSSCQAPKHQMLSSRPVVLSHHWLLVASRNGDGLQTHRVRDEDDSTSPGTQSRSRTCR